MFHGLSFGKIGQPPIVGLPANAPPGAPVPPPPPGAGAASPPGDSVRTVTRRAFAQRLRRHGADASSGTCARASRAGR